MPLSLVPATVHGSINNPPPRFWVYTLANSIHRNSIAGCCFFIVRQTSCPEHSSVVARSYWCFLQARRPLSGPQAATMFSDVVSNQLFPGILTVCLSSALGHPGDLISVLSTSSLPLQDHGLHPEDPGMVPKVPAEAWLED